MDRRRFVSVVAGGVAATSVVGGLLGRERSAQASVLTVAAVGEAYTCLRPGARVDRWTVAEVLDPRRGEIPLVLATESGERFRVDVLRRDDATPGVAQTSALGLYLCNQGGGRQATREEHGLGVMALARALAAADDAVEAGRATPRLPLLTLRERNRRFRGRAAASVG